MHEYDNNKHMQHTLIVDVDDPQQTPRQIWDLSSDEHYADPGYPVTMQLANGFQVMRQDGDWIYLSGMGSSPEGDRPFLDRFDVKTLAYERLFRSDKTSYDRFLSFTGPDTRKISDVGTVADGSAECLRADAGEACGCAGWRGDVCVDEGGDYAHS